MNIFDKVIRNPSTLCWEWVGELNRNGYGWFKRRGKRVMVHKETYEQIHGPVPEGLVVDHGCRNRRCCNPRHLEAVTVKVNTERGGAVLFRRVSNE